MLALNAAAWKCAARDRWIGWDLRHQYDRLYLIANNAGFLILPEWHVANLASRVLALCERRVRADWQARFGHPLWLLETFVDPRLFSGTCYRAANWLQVGETRGFRRIRAGYSNTTQAPKLVFVRPLIAHARAPLAHSVLDLRYHYGAPKLMLRAQQMRSLPAFFTDFPDPRRGQGRRHPLPVVLAVSAAAVLCGARGYKAIAAWAQDLSQQARARFRCRYRNGRYEVPGRTRIRDVLTRVDPDELDRALQGWHAQLAEADEAWPSTTRRCATPSTRRIVKPTSSASSDTRHRTATPKKSRLSACQRKRRAKTHQRDWHGHPGARTPRHHRQNHHR
ncbi:MAG: Druantia anti-phage system protein DruA [Thiohalocapsa sp.]